MFELGVTVLETASRNCAFAALETMYFAMRETEKDNCIMLGCFQLTNILCVIPLQALCVQYSVSELGPSPPHPFVTEHVRILCLMP